MTSAASHAELAQSLLSKMSVDEVVALMRRVAVEEILHRYHEGLKDEDIRIKTCAADLVTIADIESEKVLTRELPRIFPGSVVLGEEAVSQDPKVLELLTSDKFVWVVDPLDGTWYFRHHQPGFTMLVALTHKGIPLMGFALKPDIDNPTDHAAQKVFLAVKGIGTHIDSLANPRLTIPAPPDNIDDLKTVWITRPPGQPKARPIEMPPQIFGQCRTSKAIGIDFLGLVDGSSTHVVAYDRCFITPWDLAAAHLLILEAGGAWVQDSTPYRASKNENQQIITAPNEPLARKAWARLFPQAAAPHLIA